MKRELITLSLGLLVGTALSSVAAAQQTTGVPGAPDATSTIDGRQIPPPPAAFGGTINLDATNSTPYWQPAVVPPKGAPNILLIITDDVGFAAPSTFGGVIPTPTLDSWRIGRDGWDKICFIRPTWAVGPRAAAGSAPAHSSPAQTSARRRSWPAMEPGSHARCLGASAPSSTDR